MGKRVHRVLVTITDVQRKMAACDDKRLDNEVKILDSSTMLLRIGNNNNNGNAAKPALPLSPRYYRHLEFDAVGFEYESHVRNEIGELMEQMFRHKKNSCLLRFTPLRNYNLNLLTRIMVAEVDKVMLALHYRLKSINLEYYDVRKFDMVNLMGVAPPGQRQPRRKSRVEEPTCRYLQSTRELFQWLLSEYSVLRTRGIGDDYIDVEFNFNDMHQKAHQVHLALFQVFGSDARPDILGFFKALPTGKSSSFTLLTDCLKESFDFKRPMRTLLLFEVPMSRNCPVGLRKMLSLADAAFVNVVAAMNKSNKEGSNTSLLLRNKTILGHSSASRSTLQSQLRLANKRPMQPYMATAIERRAAAETLSKEDFNSLAYWYSRIDMKMQEVQQSMEKFYSALYQNKVLQICNQLRNLEQENVEDEECGGDNQRLHIKKAVDEVEARQKYNEVVAEFQSLSTDVEKSCYASTLKVYLSTKNYELTEEEKELKQRQIESMRLNLIQYIKSESLSQCGKQQLRS